MTSVASAWAPVVNLRPRRGSRAYSVTSSGILSPMSRELPLLVLCAAAILAPSAGRADLRLLDSELAGPSPLPVVLAPGTMRLRGPVSPDRALLAAADDESQKPAGPPAPSAPTPAPSLDFDLLAPPPPPPGQDPALARRRTLLDWHQGLGIGLFGLTLATTVVGQLNYDDRFVGSRPSTGNYLAPHAVLATSTLVAFAATGMLALLAPAPPVRRDGFDRITLHKIAMFTAAAGMAAEGALGLWTQRREGYLNQESLARAHLVLGYVVLAAVTTGVAAIVF